MFHVDRVSECRESPGECVFVGSIMHVLKCRVVDGVEDSQRNGKTVDEVGGQLMEWKAVDGVGRQSMEWEDS